MGCIVHGVAKSQARLSNIHRPPFLKPRDDALAGDAFLKTLPTLSRDPCVCF